MNVVTAWNRHLPSCTGTSSTGKRCTKCAGSGETQQRNVYAFRVMLAITGGALECPGCGVEWDGTFNVDRVRPELGYVPGNVVYICRQNCNGPRGILQGQGRDWQHVADYARLVSEASKTVQVPTIREARQAWRDMPKPEGRRCRWA